MRERPRLSTDFHKRLRITPARAGKTQLGLHLQNADGSFVGIIEAISQMREAMDGMTDTQQVGIAKAIAGEDAFSGL